MQSILDFLFGANGMMPHGYCFLWNPSLLWLLVSANAVTALSYFSIPIALGYFAFKRNDLDAHIKWMFILFGVFIFSCGTTHLLSIVTIWNPAYGLTAVADTVTALVSLITAILLWPLIPKALRLPSPATLILANNNLEQEIRFHKHTKAELEKLNQELDRLVDIRTYELDSSEKRFRTIFDKAPLGIAVVDSLTGHYQEVNPRFAEIVGYSVDEVMQSDWMQFTHPDDIEADEKAISIMNSGKDASFALTKRYRRPDNSIAWVKLTSTPIMIGASSQYHLRMIEDITDARSIELKNQQLGNILEQSFSEIYIINSKTLSFEHVNQGCIANLGFSFDELKQMTLSDINPDFDLLSSNKLLKPLLERETKQLRLESIHLRKDGTRYPVEICLQIYRNTPDYYIAICLDISQRKAMERRLVDERNLLTNIINTIPDYIFYKNIAGEYLICNTRVAEYLNRSVDEIIGRTDCDLLDTDTAQLFRERDAAVLEQNTTIINEEIIILPSGENKLLETIKTPLKNSDCEIIGLIGIARDITQRKAQEDKINRLSNFYASLSKINHAIVHIRSERKLFDAVCDIVTKINYLKSAWIGKVDASENIIKPTAVAGEYQEYLSKLKISIGAPVSDDTCTTVRAVRECRIITNNNIQLKPELIQKNYQEKHFSCSACCAIPILKNQIPYAVLNVYSNQKDIFDDDMLQLMLELSRDLTFALESYEHETARQAAEENLALSAIVYKQSQEAIIVTDKDNKIISVNRAFTAITGYDEHEVVGRGPKFLFSSSYDLDFFRTLWEKLLINNFWQGEIINRQKNGTFYPVWLTISVVRDSAGDITNCIAIFSDITQHKQAEEQIEHLAHFDVLTNLPNRILLKSRVDYEIISSERHNRTFALLFIDLDHFKNINDSLGHSVGDQVLVEVGQRLLACVREEDTVSRLGGDEFNILLTNSNEVGAAIIAKKIIGLLSEFISYRGYKLYITPSIGIALYPSNGTDYEVLSQSADTALYQAKNQGRNQFQFFTLTMQEHTQRRMEIETQLRQAILNDELIVYFQPQVETQSQIIVGAEALLRWNNPKLGMVSPIEFIPVAEETGLILLLGDWVLEQSIAYVKRCIEAGYPITIAVNLSLAQFRANTLHDKVYELLKRYQVSPKYLELELTETIAMQNVKLAIDVTNKLSELGIKLSIDDFGTGYSSLNYIQQFSLNKLKIDQSFTRDMVDNKDSENIVDAIINMAKSLKLKTIAEGVETERQLAMFKQKNCDEIQGYFFSRPVPADQFMALLKKHQSRSNAENFNTESGSL